MDISLFLCVCHQVLDLVPDPGLLGKNVGGIGDQGGLVDCHGLRSVVVTGQNQLRHGFFQGLVILGQLRPCSGQFLLHGRRGGVKHGFAVPGLPHRLEIFVCFRQNAGGPCLLLAMLRVIDHHVTVIA